MRGVLGLLLIAACSGRAAAPPDAGAIVLRLLVDDELVAELPASALRERRRLAELLPERARVPAGWIEVVGEGAPGRAVYVRRPAELYVGQTAWLYLADDGTPALGVFVDKPPASLGDRPVPASAGGSGLHLVRVVTRAPEDDTAPELAHPVRVPMGDTLTPALLDDVPLADPPRRTGGAQPGWDLAAILRARHGQALPALELVGADGQRVTLTAAQLADKQQLVHLRWNRRGQARVRIWKLGEAPRLEAELGDLVEVRVVEAKPAR